MLVRVIWSPSALAEIGHIYDYVADFNPSAAADLAAALLVAGDALVNLPRRGRSVGGNLRELTSVYPYIIRYEIRGDEVHILRVRHGMRRQ
jgi:toxin ParE1/3/4